MGSEFGYIDRDGNISINPQFKKASIFNDSIAIVEVSKNPDGVCYIRNDGTYLNGIYYKSATHYSNGRAWVIKENSSPQLINDEGEVLKIATEAERVRMFFEGLSAFESNTVNASGKWGFFSESGNTEIPPKYNDVKNFQEGLCAVQDSTQLWGYIDSHGSVVIQFQYDESLDFKYSKAIVKQGSKFGIIDKKGNYVLSPQYSLIQVDGEQFIYEQYGKKGWLDSLGIVIINPQFSGVKAFGNNRLAPAKSGDKWGYINNEGRFEINPQFEEGFPFVEGRAFIKAYGKYGLINEKGEFIVNPQFNDISKDLKEIQPENYEINSDTLDINAAFKNFNILSPDLLINIGMDFNSILKNYMLTETSFSQSVEVHLIKNEVVLSNDIKFSLAIYGNPWEPPGEGSYLLSEQLFNRQQKINGFRVQFKLAEKAQKKLENIKEKLILSISAAKRGYKEILETDPIFAILSSKLNTPTNLISIYRNSAGQTIFIQKNNIAIEVSVMAHLGIYSESTAEVMVEKSFFYDKPNGRIQRTYLVFGDIINIVGRSGDFVYTEYKNSRGQITKGWINSYDLSQ